MGRTLHRLSPTKVRTAKDTGMYADGGGLYLQVKAGADGRINRVGSSIRHPRNNDQRERHRGQKARWARLARHQPPPRPAKPPCTVVSCESKVDPIAAREAERTKATLGGARDDVRSVPRRLHRHVPSRLAERQARVTMDEHPHDLCNSGLRQVARRCYRYGVGYESRGVALGSEVRDREPSPWPDRSDPRLGHSPRLPAG
jgi:hypothetical protein